MFRSAILSVLCWLAAAGASMAQGITPPKEILLYAHQDLEADGLVQQLACELSAVMVAPVRVRTVEVPIDFNLIATGDYLDADRTIRRLRMIIGEERQFGLDSFVLMLMPYYLFNKYPVLGTSIGGPYNIGVVSVGSLVPPGTDFRVPEMRKVVSSRIFKVGFRYMTHMSGLWERNGCVLEIPNGLASIDRKPAELCEDDRATLVAAGVLKATPDKSCDLKAR
jgi:predicted Zn-dependent protease